MGKVETAGIGSEAANELMKNALVWDMTLPWTKDYADDATLDRFHAAGIDVISLTLGSRHSSASVGRWIGEVTEWIGQRSDRMKHCRSISEIDEARAQGKLALLYNIQDTLPFEERLDEIQNFYDLGVRHALLAYNVRNTVADGCAEEADAGLSRWGRAVVEEMNRVGMLVCGTHTGIRSTLEAMEITKAPFIFSHSNAYGVYPHYRNIHDEQIRACAGTGGVIGINGLGEFLDDHEATSQSMFRHIDYIANLVGPEHVGIGLDYVKDIDFFWDWVEHKTAMWPLNPNQARTRTKFGQPEQLAELAELMLVARYPEDAIRNVLGGNFRRVGLQTWK